MDSELLSSLLLVAAGAGITVLVDWLRARSARKKEREDREEARQEVRRLEGRAHAVDLLSHLDTLWQHISDTREASGVPLPKPASRKVHSAYLLIPDDTVRSVVQNAMYGASNFSALDDAPTFEEWNTNRGKQQEYILIARQSVAAYLRGDEPPADGVRLLSTVSDHLDGRFGV